MNRKKLITIVIGVVIVIVLLVLFLSREKKSPTELTASEVVAANIRFTERFRQAEESLTFFTGTAIAKLPINKRGAKPVSSLVFDDVPFVGVDRVSTDGDTTIVRAQYDPAESLLVLRDANTSTQRLGEGRNWFIVERDGVVRGLPIPEQPKIIDSFVKDGVVYVLRNKSNQEQELLSLEIKSGHLITLLEATASTSLVGVHDSVVVMRDFTGKLYLYSKGKTEVITDQAGTVLMDGETGKIVFDEAEDDEVSDEGGLAISEKPEGQRPENKLKIYDIGTGEIKEMQIPTSLFYVSRGFILTIPALSKPTSVTVIDLQTNRSSVIQIDQSKTKVTNPISQLHVLRDDLSLLGGITNNYQLVLYGAAREIENTEPFKLPVIGSDIEEYGVEYDIGKQQVSIMYPRGAASRDVVSKTLGALRSSCECDINQVNKIWLPTSADPGL